MASAPDIDGGLVAGPGGDLFYTTYPDNTLGEIKAGSPSANKLVNLTNLGVTPSTGGLGLVPSGFSNGGHLKITSYDASKMFDTALSPDGSGTYNVAHAGSDVELFGAVNSHDSAVFIPAGNPLFVANTALICDYSNLNNPSKVVAYQTDGNSDPIVSTGTDFLVNLPQAAGIVIDPVTHDVLIAGQDNTGICVVTGFTDAHISAITPASVPAGTSFTLTVNGSGFLPGAQIRWNGTLLTTTVTSTKLTASVSSSINTTLSSYPGAVIITAQSSDGTLSNSVSLSIAAPSLSVTNIKPSTVKADTAFTLTIDGTNFRNGASVSWNDTPLKTTFVSSNQLSVAVTTAANGFTASYPTAAVITITSPGSLTTASETVTVTEATPILTSLSPGGAPVGQGPNPFSLTVVGDGFVSGAVIKWNGIAMPSTVYSQTVIGATVPASYLAALGTIPITVTNPTSGGTSFPMDFLVLPTRISVSYFGAASRDPNTGNILVPIYLINTGYQTAPAMKITSSSLGSDAAPTNALPISLGNLAVQSAVFTTLTFKGTAGARLSPATVTVSGTYTGGIFHWSTVIPYLP